VEGEDDDSLYKKSEAQTFLTKFFQAFGHEEINEAGAEFEDRLKKGSAKGKTGFADLVWRMMALTQAYLEWE
jgi:hypothetical protein